MIRFAELNERESRALDRALRVPALWPLAILAGVIGFDAAVEACETRELSDEAANRMQDAGYYVDDLPPHESVRAILSGLRLRDRQRRGEPLQAVARRLGMTLREAVRALEMLRCYGVRKKDLERRSSTGRVL